MTLRDLWGWNYDIQADLLRICRLVLSDPNKDLNKSGTDRDPPQKMKLDHYKLNNYSAFSPMANHLQRFDIFKVVTQCY